MNILDLTEGLIKQDGEVGIEIEVEGRYLPEVIVGWRRENDGSLRGESCEYVLKKPCLRGKVTEYLGRMEKAYRDSGTKVRESERQSIHIHINVQDIDMVKVYNFVTLFLMFEHSLVSFCGEHRQGNLFCLRSEDAEGLFTTLEDAACPENLFKLGSEEIRYSAINVSSLYKYGSLEFRSMRGTADFGLVKTWINILLALKDKAKLYDNPADIIADLSGKGIKTFTTEVFGDDANIIFEQKDWDTHLYSNMRAIQSLAFSGDWEGLSGKKKEEEVEYFGVGRGRPMVDRDAVARMVDVDDFPQAAPPPPIHEPVEAVIERIKERERRAVEADRIRRAAQLEEIVELRKNVKADAKVKVPKAFFIDIEADDNVLKNGEIKGEW